MNTQRGFIGYGAMLGIAFSLLVVGGGAYFINKAAKLSASPSFGNAPLTVSFSTNYSYPDTYPGSKMLPVDFGDDTMGDTWGMSAGNSVKHTYSNPGVYIATLSGCSLRTDIQCESVLVGIETVIVTDSDR